MKKDMKYFINTIFFLSCFFLLLYSQPEYSVKVSETIFYKNMALDIMGEKIKIEKNINEYKVKKAFYDTSNLENLTEILKININALYRQTENYEIKSQILEINFQIQKIEKLIKQIKKKRKTKNYRNDLISLESNVYKLFVYLNGFSTNISKHKI